MYVKRYSYDVRDLLGGQHKGQDPISMSTIGGDLRLDNVGKSADHVVQLEDQPTNSQESGESE